MQLQPVLDRVNEGGMERTHIRFCYPDAAHCVTEYDLDEKCLDDLAYVLKIAKELSEKNKFLFHEGDWMIFDNNRTFHSKTKTSKNTHRMLKKIKLQIERNKIYS